MDPIQNPYTPGPGTPPAWLAGRETLLERGRLHFGRLKRGLPEKSLLIVGPAGLGKTVLLHALAQEAQWLGVSSVRIEAHAGRGLGTLLVPALRARLWDPALDGRPSQAAQAALDGFTARHAPQLKTQPLAPAARPGVADSGDLEADLLALLLAVATDGRDRHWALAALVDELHALAPDEVQALLWAQQGLQRDHAPLSLVLAGLPCLTGFTEPQRALAERLFEVLELTPLDGAAAAQALQGPAQAAGAHWEDAALRELLRSSKGHPFALQAWAAETWNAAAGPGLDLKAVRAAAPAVQRRLDASFYGPGFPRLNPRERAYLRTMAHLGAGPMRSADIADSMDAKITALGPLRAALIKKGLLYSPAHGWMAFALPGYDDFMRRTLPQFR